MSEAQHVYKAITAVTAAMAKEGIAKGKSNAQQGYKFRGIDDVYNALASVLAANSLCILPRVVDRDFAERTTKAGAALHYTTLTVDFDLVSSVDGSSHTIRTIGEAMDSADKSSNKAMSAAMKYACLVAFQIPTEGDDDADAHTPEPARGKPVAAPAVTSTASPAEVDAVVASFVDRIDAATELAALMTIYAESQAAALPTRSKAYLKGLLSTKRSSLEKAA